MFVTVRRNKYVLFYSIILLSSAKNKKSGVSDPDVLDIPGSIVMKFYEMSPERLALES